MINEIIKPDWNSERIDVHRRGISDIEWLIKNTDNKQLYYIGDVVEFKVGGIGLICKVEFSQGAYTYAAEKVKGYPFHKKNKLAWHYNGDIKQLIEASGIRKLLKKKRIKKDEVIE